ncbi:MAG: polysaccharide biosynthesis C-terminal domain-containing protein [Pirellulaceae bacterium]
MPSTWRLLALFTTWSMLLRGIGRIECLVPVYVTQTAINVTLSLILVRWLGLLGPVLGTVVGFCSVTVWWLPQVLKRELRLSRNSLAYAVAGPSVLMSASVVVVRLVATKYPPANWLAWFGSTATFSLVFLLAAWWLCLATHERRLWGLRFQTWCGAKRSVIA